MISLIAAMSENRIIGKNGKMPWHLPADLKHFKQMTLNKPVIMGRKTYQSIGKALPQRTNIIMTADTQFYAPECIIAHSMIEAVEGIPLHEEIMVMGGHQIYQQFLTVADRMYLTFIHQHFEGDTTFPQWDPKQWREVQREDHAADENNPYDYSFITLERIPDCC